VSAFDRFTGFSQLYDKNRPRPPRALPGLMLSLARKDRVRRVVDLGSGTGLSTFLWARYADEVLGIEPNDDMREIAEKKAARYGRGNVAFRNADSYHTRVKANSVDIVMCCQAFHWMEPKATLEEAHRILSRKGILVVCDCDWPPTVGREAEEAYLLLESTVKGIVARNRTLDRVRRWDKSRHLENIRGCGHFSFVKEILLLNREQGNAARFVNLALSQGSIQNLLKRGVSAQSLGIPRFIRTVQRSLSGSTPFYFSYRIRIGMR
jgi:SAM-dependent methyltransferase